MNKILLTTGLACVIGAIVGGGLKGFGVEIPLLQSSKRQVMLALFGFALLIAGSLSEEATTATGTNDPGAVSPAPIGEGKKPKSEQLLAELKENNETIRGLEVSLAKQAIETPLLEREVNKLEGSLQRGEVHPANRVQMEKTVEIARLQISKTKEVDARNRQTIDSLKQRNNEIEQELRNR